MSEIWRDVDGWPYQVSNIGRVRNRSGKILAMPAHKSGYLNVQLWRDGTFRTWLVHRLVAVTFLGEPPTEAHEVAHGNGDRHDNHISNLRWVLHKENMRDRDLHGATARGSRNGRVKHDDAAVLSVRQMHAQGLGYRRISKATGISRAAVRCYILGKLRPTATGVKE